MRKKICFVVAIPGTAQSFLCDHIASLSKEYDVYLAGNIKGESDVDGLHEMTEGAGILFPHGDDEALTDLIRQLHDNQQLYQQVADACYEKACQFDISKMVEKYNEVYMELSRN